MFLLSFASITVAMCSVVQAQSTVMRQRFNASNCQIQEPDEVYYYLNGVVKGNASVGGTYIHCPVPSAEYDFSSTPDLTTEGATISVKNGNSTNTMNVYLATTYLNTSSSNFTYSLDDTSVAPGGTSFTSFFLENDNYPLWGASLKIWVYMRKDMEFAEYVAVHR